MYDWVAIQKFYDAGATFKELRDEFGIAVQSITKARKTGRFVARSRGDAQKLSHERGRKPPLTEETKSKISDRRKDFIKRNPDKVPYVLNHYSKRVSPDEGYWFNVLTERDISFRREVPVGRYRLDFLIGSINLEIDGEQHYVDKRIIESDSKRDAVLSEKGYTTIRIRSRDYNRLSAQGKEEFISNLIANLTR